jgi:protein-tyrosine phosphatase
MAERLLTLRFTEALGPQADELLRSVSAGTGDWHLGQPMDPMAQQQILARGGDIAGFSAQQINTKLVDNADLILTATAEHSALLSQRWPHATPRIFLLREFARLASEIDLSKLPGFLPTLESFQQRATALVQEVTILRADKDPLPDDELDDPYQLNSKVFTRVANEIDEAVTTIVDTCTNSI